MYMFVYMCVDISTHVYVYEHVTIVTCSRGVCEGGRRPPSSLVTYIYAYMYICMGTCMYMYPCVYIHTKFQGTDPET